MLKMVVFDMAGTTLNENNVVYKTLQKALNEKGFNFSLEQVLAEGAGKEKLQAIKSIMGAYAQNYNDLLAEEIYTHFIGLLKEAYDKLEILPQDNAVELFKALKQRNILVILNTGYNFETAASLINKLGWQKGVEFDGLVTSTDVRKNRPEPDMILFAMERFNVQNGREIIKVGDSIIDIEEGQNAGCLLNIGITTGAHTKEQLESAAPDYIIDNLLELLPIVDKLVI